MIVNTRITAAVLLVVAMVSSTVNAAYPVWCICQSSALSAHPCDVAGGNYDGGSCGLTNSAKCKRFQAQCQNEQQQGIRCWDSNNKPASC
ncbi:hypothetical protein EDD11_010447 [Mortierella claussenii]|nr:hypothetical protein EDD11_010447 [Mortierella claussenii]